MRLTLLALLLLLLLGALPARAQQVLQPPFGPSSGAVIARNAVAYGADPTGVADSATAINAALAADSNGLYHNVYLPSQSSATYHIKSALTVHAGQCLFSDNPSQATITVGFDYSASAGSPITLSGVSFSTPCVHNLYIAFVQPSSVGARANFVTLASGNCGVLISGSNYYGCQYPAAIDASTAYEAEIRDVYIGNAWDCIKGYWNTGGTFTNSVGRIDLRNISCGAFDRGLDLQGSTGIVYIDAYHFFPWGMSPSNNTNVYLDGGTFAAVFNNMQGITSNGFFSQNGRVSITGSQQTTFDHFVDLEMDADNATFEVNSTTVDVTIAGGYSNGSASGVNTASELNVTNAPNVSVSSHSFRGSSTSTVSPVAVIGGSVSIANSQIIPSVTGASAISQSGGVLIMSSDNVENGTASAWSVPLISSTGGTYNITNTSFGLSGSGTAISGTDSAANAVVGNTFTSSWTFAPPGPLGSYDGTSWPSVSLTLTCSNSHALSSYTATGYYHHLGKVMDLITSVILTNVGTCTTSDQIYIATLPGPTPVDVSIGTGREGYTGKMLLLLQSGATMYYTFYDGTNPIANSYVYNTSIRYATQ